MTLRPSQPPGHRSRKARAFAPDIARLHAQGYSLDAIRLTLAEAGVTVSRSTVWREVVRPLPPALSPQGTPTLGTAPAASIAHAASPPDAIPMDRPRMPAIGPAPAVPAPNVASNASRLTGKEVAEVFSQQFISNPLYRHRT